MLITCGEKRRIQLNLILVVMETRVGFNCEHWVNQHVVCTKHCDNHNFFFNMSNTITLHVRYRS